MVRFGLSQQEVSSRRKWVAKTRQQVICNANRTATHAAQKMRNKMCATSAICRSSRERLYSALWQLLDKVEHRSLQLSQTQNGFITIKQMQQDWNCNLRNVFTRPVRKHCCWIKSTCRIWSERCQRQHRVLKAGSSSERRQRPLHQLRARPAAAAHEVVQLASTCPVNDYLVRIRFSHECHLHCWTISFLHVKILVSSPRWPKHVLTSEG